MHEEHARPESRLDWEEVRDTLRSDWEKTKTAAKRPARYDWLHAQTALKFGYSASHWYRRRFPNWSPGLEERLSMEWQVYQPDSFDWADVREVVRQGYEFGCCLR